MEGSSVTLHCEVDSNPAARISWMFGDQELLWDTAANVSLSLDDMSAAQEGVYTCVGDNGYGAMNASLYLSIKCKSQNTPPAASRSAHSASSGRAHVLRHPELINNIKIGYRVRAHCCLPPYYYYSCRNNNTYAQ